MNIQTYMSCFAAGMLGIVIHVFFVKLPGLKKRAKAANTPFGATDYLKDDWIGIGSSILTVMALILCLDELVKIKPVVMDYLKFTFLFVGYTGSSLLLAVFSKTDKAINQVIDSKTNELDELKSS